ncbi:MAG: putative selenate reductase subunit YgfK [Spirochaetaceae bacterium]
MGDIMRPIPFGEMVKRIFEEYRQIGSIFGIPKIHFFRKQNDNRIHTFRDTCDTPIGPAAGPHTQMSQNIVASYLAGGRFIELKTVQKLDNLEIDKPCIDARDECYNTEWSTEFSLEKAYDEYVKAWILLHLLEEIFEMRLDPRDRSFIFNMSIGYDLEGIKTEKMDRYINDMIDSSGNELFNDYLNELAELISEGSFLRGTGLEERLDALGGIEKRIPAAVSPTVTLSTMHGCPPDEQEAICRYLLTEKKIDTYVKLNPTLLGYEKVREILDSLGYEYLHISRDSFDHDLQYDDAVAMLARLIDTAKREGKEFGVKLSNTLGSINDQGALPGEDMFMSGRALYPLTINLAAALSEEFEGKLPISYSGGAGAFNVVDIFETGIRPITIATDMLKPGGYLRMKEMALKLETSKAWDAGSVDPQAVRALAEKALDAGYTKKEFRGKDVISTGKPLPLFDCYVAPCTVACPIGQDVPEYIRLTGEGRYEEALDLIYEKNALPNITGYICDHQCMYNCTRLDYEGAVQIRELKRVAAEKGWEKYVARRSAAGASAAAGASFGTEGVKGAKAAVIGAGPAGLSAAYFLAREGLDVTVLEKQPNAGGVVRNVIPHFRLPQEAIEKDIEFIKKSGVDFQFGVSPDFAAEDLKNDGYTYVFLGIGAEKDNRMELDGADGRVRESLDFLRAYRGNSNTPDLRGHVAVVGGGNTAMDSARAAMSLDAVGKVTVLYRRAKEQMPADLEEYENAVKDGVEFRFLRNPEKLEADGKLSVRVMELGEKDASGRARPVKTDKTEELKIDHLITAIGEHVDTDALEAFGVPLGEDGWPVVDEKTLETGEENVYLGGDAQSGPSTVVQCIAAGRKAADDIARKEKRGESREDRLPEFNPEKIRQEVLSRKGAIIEPADPKNAGSDSAFAQAEAKRCLECSYICNKCVEVCPNRANIVIPVEIAEASGNKIGFGQEYQIIHLDALCNECGNCAIFCPWEGKPYKDKLTVFSLKKDFMGSDNPGFFIEGGTSGEATLYLRLEGEVRELSIDDQGQISGGAGETKNMGDTKNAGAAGEVGDADPMAAALIGEIYRNYGYLLGEVIE